MERPSENVIKRKKLERIVLINKTHPEYAKNIKLEDLRYVFLVHISSSQAFHYIVGRNDPPKANRLIISKVLTESDPFYQGIVDVKLSKDLREDIPIINIFNECQDGDTIYISHTRREGEHWKRLLTVINVPEFKK